MPYITHPSLPWEFRQLRCFSNSKTLVRISLVTPKGAFRTMLKSHILPSFKDPILRGWISSDRKHLASLKFSDFMTLLRSKFLSKQWEDELLSQILRDHLRSGQDFLTWATKLQQQNCILRNTTPSSTRKGFANKFLSRLISTCASSLEKRKYRKLPRFKISSTFILFVTTNVEPWKHELVR